MGEYKTGMPSSAITELNISWPRFIRAQGRIASYLRSHSKSGCKPVLSANQMTQQDLPRINVALVSDGSLLMKTARLETNHDQRLLLAMLKQRYGAVACASNANDYTSLQQQLVKPSCCHRLLSQYLLSHLNQAALLAMSTPLSMFRTEYIKLTGDDAIADYKIRPLFTVNLLSDQHARIECEWYTDDGEHLQALAKSQLELKIKQGKLVRQQMDFQLYANCLAYFHQQKVQQQTIDSMSSLAVDERGNNKFSANHVAIADAINQLLQHADQLKVHSTLKSQALYEVAAVASRYLGASINQKPTAAIQTQLASVLIRHRKVLGSHRNIVMRLIKGVLQFFSKITANKKPTLSRSAHSTFAADRLTTRSAALASQALQKTQASRLSFTLC